MQYIVLDQTPSGAATNKHILYGKLPLGVSTFSGAITEFTDIRMLPPGEIHLSLDIANEKLRLFDSGRTYNDNVNINNIFDKSGVLYVGATPRDKFVAIVNKVTF